MNPCNTCKRCKSKCEVGLRILPHVLSPLYPIWRAVFPPNQLFPSRVQWSVFGELGDQFGATSARDNKCGLMALKPRDRWVVLCSILVGISMVWIGMNRFKDWCMED